MNAAPRAWPKFEVTESRLADPPTPICPTALTTAMTTQKDRPPLMTISQTCRCQCRVTKASCTNTHTKAWTATTTSIRHPILTRQAWACTGTVHVSTHIKRTRDISTTLVLTGLTKNVIILTGTLQTIRDLWVPLNQFLKLTQLRLYGWDSVRMKLGAKTTARRTVRSRLQLFNNMTIGRQVHVRGTALKKLLHPATMHPVI